MDGLAYGFEAGEVDDGGWLVVVKDLFESGLIQKVAFNESEVFAGDLLDPAQGFFLAVAKVVDGYDIVAGLQEFDASVGADIAGAAGYEDGIVHVSYLLDSGSHM